MVVAVPVLAGSGKPPLRAPTSAPVVDAQGFKTAAAPENWPFGESACRPTTARARFVWTDASGLPAADHAESRRGQGTAHAGCDTGGPLLPRQKGRGRQEEKDEKAEAAKKVASKFAMATPKSWLRLAVRRSDA